ncbi:MAG: DUF1772 domain-containing protein, partial [Kutzneria sp.]|nr:DUF1772 domain-containing protein [Kutzneria sp.]
MDKLTSRMLAVARFAHAYWFFGNLYEAVVRTPDTVIDNSSVTGLKPGSPVRYYLPAIPAVAATTVAGAALGWRRGGSRPALATAVGCLAASG